MLNPHIPFRPLLPWAVAALALAGATAASAQTTWRVDFNGSGDDTLAVSNFSGWIVSAANRTQALERADGGAPARSLSVSLSGAGGATWSSFQRSMNAGGSTNLYRDGVQCNGSALTVQLSGLSAGAGCALRLWYFDDEFSTGVTQSYVDVTDGGATFLGALTNVATANLGGGHAGLPSGLYDARYVLAASRVAGPQGTLDVSITPGTGNAKLNALEVVEDAPAPAVTYAETLFTEAPANDGSIGNTLLLTLAHAVWAGTDGDDFIAAGRAQVDQVPAGLQAQLLRTSSNTLSFTLAGQAAEHAAADSIDDLALTLLDAAFLEQPASPVAGAVRSDLVVNFSDAAVQLASNAMGWSWSSVPGQRYSVEYAAHPAGTFIALASNVPADLAFTSLTSASPAGATATAIFRVRVE